jgi:FKBP-type peptidyl-prolyl cis-trans isomerase (trigger factor)
MTQASSARNEKRLGKKKPQHQTHSFAQMMSAAQLKALEPYIQQLVAEQFRQATQGIYQFVMNERQMMTTRQLAFETLLSENTDWFTNEKLGLAIVKVEDDALGLKSVDDGAASGDKIRLEFQAMGHAQTEYSAVNKLTINDLQAKGPNGTVQTHEALETALLGMKVGETKEFLVPEPVEEGKEPEHTKVKVTVKRISRAPVPEVTAKNEGGKSE